MRLDTDHEWAECDRRAEPSRAVARATSGANDGWSLLGAAAQFANQTASSVIEKAVIV
jgi:hypothetical protein